MLKYSSFHFGLIGTETRIVPYLLGVMHLIVMQQRLIGSVIPLAERDVNKRRCWCDWIWQEEVCVVLISGTNTRRLSIVIADSQELHSRGSPDRLVLSLWAWQTRLPPVGGYVQYRRVYRFYEVFFSGLWIHSFSWVQHSAHPYFSSTIIWIFSGKLTTQHIDIFLKKMKEEEQSDSLNTWLFLACSELFTLSAVYKYAKFFCPFIYLWSKTKFFSWLLNAVCLKKGGK